MAAVTAAPAKEARQERNVTMGGKTGFKSYITVLSVLLTMFLGKAQAAQNLDYTLYDTMLKKYVSIGTVDYLKWKKNDLAAFEQYINGLGKVSLTDLNENEQKAFWINAYNALTIYAVLKHISTNELLAKGFSVQMVSGFFDKITYRVAGEALTLDNIEKEKLRKGFHDSRIHFALVCASRSCPKIENTVFKAEGLEERLENAARNFIQDTARNRFDQKNNVLYLSKIFRWYNSDFIASSGTVVDFVKKYIGKEAVEYLSSRTVKTRYLFYDWLVNIKS